MTLHINYLEREAKNQIIGNAREEFILNYERARLIYAGKENLSDKVEHVAHVAHRIGPTAGFDIHSYDITGQDRFIEVKTTQLAKQTPFYITPNELSFSNCNSKNYYLYRVFHFGKNPNAFSLQGRLENHCQLTPTEYYARLK